MNTNYIFLLALISTTISASQPAKSEHLSQPAFQASCSSAPAVKIYADKGIQTDSSFDMQDIRAMVAPKTTAQLMCVFAKSQLSQLTKQAAEGDFDSMKALQLFEKAMHANYINQIDNDDNRIEACNKLLHLKLLEVYAAGAYQVTRPMREALIAEGIYSTACDQKTIALNDVERQSRQDEFYQQMLTQSNCGNNDPDSVNADAIALWQ